VFYQFVTSPVYLFYFIYSVSAPIFLMFWVVTCFL
jgi:hypothetical protein